MKRKSEAMFTCYGAFIFLAIGILLTLLAIQRTYRQGMEGGLLRYYLLADAACLLLCGTLLLSLRDYLSEIAVKAYTDVTGVKDRKALEKYLRQLCERSNTLDIGIMMFDLNGLKWVNDTYGHEKGDLYIQTFASFLTKVLNENSFLARFGGDEFVIVQEHTTLKELEGMNKKLQEALEEYNRATAFPISYAVGYEVSYKNHYYLMEDLMRAADQKMYQDKIWKKQRAADKQSARSSRQRPIPSISADILAAKLKTVLEEGEEKSYVLAMMDIEKFHFINGVYGYPTGNAVLNAVFHALRESNQGAFTQRFHSDIFISIIETTGLKTECVAKWLREQSREIEKKITDTFPLGCFTINTGFCELANPELLPQEYISRANVARRAAKSDADHICCYSGQMEQREKQSAQIVHSFRKALKEQEFKIYFQPKVGGSDRKVHGAEVLVRWEQENGGFWQPGSFIPMLEQTGDIVALDFYVYEKAFHWLAKQRELGRPVVPISLNISPVHFSNPELLVNTVERLLTNYQIDTKDVIFEITESIYIDDPDTVNEVIEKFHRRNIKISMDDFGSGYSSLNTLKDILFDEVKLDRKFVSDGLSTTGRIVLQELLHLLKRMHKEIVCEGVETQAVADFLSEEGCTELQGFLFYKPMKTEEFTALLQKNILAAHRERAAG